MTSLIKIALPFVVEISPIFIADNTPLSVLILATTSPIETQLLPMVLFSSPHVITPTFIADPLVVIKSPPILIAVPLVVVKSPPILIPLLSPITLFLTNIAESLLDVTEPLIYMADASDIIELSTVIALPFFDSIRPLIVIASEFVAVTLPFSYTAFSYVDI